MAAPPSSTPARSTQGQAVTCCPQPLTLAWAPGWPPQGPCRDTVLRLTDMHEHQLHPLGLLGVLHFSVQHSYIHAQSSLEAPAASPHAAHSHGHSTHTLGKQRKFQGKIRSQDGSTPLVSRQSAPSTLGVERSGPSQRDGQPQSWKGGASWGAFAWAWCCGCTQSFPEMPASKRRSLTRQGRGSCPVPCSSLMPGAAQANTQRQQTLSTERARELPAAGPLWQPMFSHSDSLKLEVRR